MIIAEAGDVFRQAIMITGFVFVMMLVIEYINVQTKGLWHTQFLGNNRKQYIVAALLGVIPGCLGAFTAVSLFSHRLISFGAIVTAMIATSGDEAFVMFAMFPEKALGITFLILIIGIITGFIVDKLNIKRKLMFLFPEHKFPLHEEQNCKCFQKDLFINQWRKPSPNRVLLVLLILSLLISISIGILAGSAELWIRVTLLLSVGFSLFIVISVPEHFLKEHLWDHIVKMHLPRIFLWTFGTLLVFSFLMNYIDVQTWLSENMWIVLIVAVLVGIIPESGPHLIFVTLFAQGTIPISILLASSVSQDGHGMLPLLAESKKGFFAVKLVNIIVALLTGIIGYLLGF
ncbi:MAG: arsenic efflux protein [Cyclobacteriaceae bacterium]|nr:arsenic efflux protein [Cyclobacteriaceae bacterium]